MGVSIYRRLCLRQYWPWVLSTVHCGLPLRNFTDSSVQIVSGLHRSTYGLRARTNSESTVPNTYRTTSRIQETPQRQFRDRLYGLASISVLKRVFAGWSIDGARQIAEALRLRTHWSTWVHSPSTEGRIASHCSGLHRSLLQTVDSQDALTYICICSKAWCKKHN